MDVGERESKARWFPFTATEIEVALGAFGFVASIGAYAGVDQKLIAVSAVAYLSLLYLAGLMVYFRGAASSRFSFLPDGSLGGLGYIERFRRARRSLFLMHLDDDKPGAELQALYSTLLDRGVQIRRVLFLRTPESGLGLDWVIKCGNHKNLQQRVVLPEDGRLMRLCFVLVDDTEVLIAVPGYEPVDGAPFTPGFLLRHLLILRDPQVAAAFVEVYEQVWNAAQPLDDAKRLSDPPALIQKLRSARSRR